MKKNILIILINLIIITTIIYQFKNNTIKKYTVAIIQCASNKSLDLLSNSFINEIKKIFNNNINIIYKNAEGSLPNAHSIAHELHLNKKIDLFFSIGSSVSQAIANLEDTRPIIIAGISDPKAHNLNKKNICGTIDAIDEEAILTMINKNSIKNQKIGILRTAGEINEKEFIYFKALCKKNNKNCNDFAFYSEAEIISTIEQICQNIDILLIPCDSLVVSTLPYIIKIAKKYKIPIFTCFIEGILLGATASTGTDYEINGIESAKIAEILILKKESSEKISFKKANYKNINTVHALPIE